jgi:hypothetical protein
MLLETAARRYRQCLLPHRIRLQYNSIHPRRGSGTYSEFP